jgi:type II secretory pathway predicted ATPase ExeA
VTLPPQRPIVYDAHPVVQQSYVVPTVSIDTAFAQIMRCIKHRVPGAMLVGQSRVGKTRCVGYISQTLHETIRKVNVLTFLVEKKKQPVESAFFENLLVAVGHKEPHRGNNSIKRQRLYASLVERAVASGSNQLVVFADEAHRLEALEYEWLWDVHDRLESQHIRMITFLVGNHKLLNQRSAFRQAGETPIIARFMVEEIPFHGIRNVREAATCMAAYDAAEFPAGSGWTYTRFFFPLAYETGMRLVKQARALSDAFDSAHKNAGFRHKLEIPMTYFTRAIEWVFENQSANDAASFVLTEAIWDEAVKMSGYVNATTQSWIDSDDE